ncbi:hypothetical protein LCGC14_1391820 [marine sediment metagenome]|uniref:Uncharacterized protein n=1 Tax=marine sediment metagenome TaxID=412755 RepID=A0A0F9JZS6_9ZZZZ
MAEEGMVTTRNLIDSDVGPLRRVTGILDSIPTDRQTYGQGETAKESTRISINLKELEVLEAIEPYHFPIYTASMTLSNRKKSRWGVFGQSLNDILDSQYSAEQLDPTNPAYLKPSDRMDIKDCIGKRVGIVMADGEGGRPARVMLFDGRAEGGKGADVPTATWMVYSVEGVGVAGGQGQSAADLAASLLDGKTLADFNAAALANPVIRADTALLQSISKPPTAPDSFANSMLTAGKFTKDAQEVYHKV